MDRARASWEVERRREGPAPFDHYDGVLGIPVDRGERRFSVSELGDLARCGFRWWSRSVLGLREPEEGEPPALIGSLYHRTLEIAARDAEGSEDVRQGVLGEPGGRLRGSGAGAGDGPGAGLGPLAGGLPGAARAGG